MTPTNAPAVGNPVAVNAAAMHAKAAELGKLVLKMTTAAGSGHPSSALALTHLAVELMYRRMRYDLADPWNPNNDRLVLSEGHAVPIVYAAYADLGGTVGVDSAHARLMKVDELATLRELTGVLEGHPNPAEGFPFFDAATGSLGQGLSVGAGLAAAARLDGIDKRIYVIVGDGESREGQVWEAADFIVDHGLSNVCLVLSCNGHGQASEVSSQQSAETLAAKIAAFGWHVIELDGHDPEAIAAAFDEVESMPKPTALVARTVKGWGVDLMLGKNFHGKPVPAADLDKACAQLDATVKRLGATLDGTSATPRVMAPCAGTSDAPRCPLPVFAEGLSRVGLEAALDKKKLATRVAYGAALVALGDVDPRVVSLDADVSNSTFSLYFAKHHADRFFECKIAEQNMISVGVGLAAAGKIAFASSFAKFIARGVDQIDMAAISRVNLKIVGSHGGASLGPDGPSQMSLSDVAYFRSMTRVDNGRGTPVCHFFQPSDAVSAFACVELMAEVDGLCFMRTHRGAAPFLYALDERFDLCGVKQLRTGDRLTLVSSGFMLHTVLKAADALAEAGVACNVFDAYTFPMESAPILNAAERAGGVILTVEDNFVGGLHSELAEVAALDGRVRVAGLTVNRLPRSAKSADEMFDYVGVGLDRIIERAKSLV